MTIILFAMLGDNEKYMTEKKNRQSSELNEYSSANTTSRNKKRIIRHATLSLINQRHLRVVHSDNELVMFRVLARINEVTLRGQYYCLDIVDATAVSNVILPRKLFSSSKADSELRELQFEKGTQEGHPYFMILLK